MTGANSVAQATLCSQSVGGGGQSLSTVPVPDVASSCPSILQKIISQNLQGRPALLAFIPMPSCRIELPKGSCYTASPSGLTLASKPTLPMALEDLHTLHGSCAWVQRWRRCICWIGTTSTLCASWSAQTLKSATGKCAAPSPPPPSRPRPRPRPVQAAAPGRPRPWLHVTSSAGMRTPTTSPSSP